MTYSHIPKKAKRDGNEREIKQALERVGCSVQELSSTGVPDLLVGFVDMRGRKSIVLMEVKHKKGKRTPDQIEWSLWWTGSEPVVVRSVEDALKAVGRLAE